MMPNPRGREPGAELSPYEGPSLCSQRASLGWGEGAGPVMQIRAFDWLGPAEAQVRR